MPTRTKTRLATFLAVSLAAAGVAAAPSHASSLHHCGQRFNSDVYANSVTSCGFADDVAYAYLDTGDHHPSVSSAATGRTYRMSCYSTHDTDYCTGGRGAYVRMVPRS